MKLVAYYRVSTDKQGRSGLGIEAQTRAVADYVRLHGAEKVAEFTEVESGKRADRPRLRDALAQAKRSKARLVVAKLDRLARSVHFISGLMESGVEFVACDNPHANRLTVQILAAVAEAEAKAISDRTKAALAAAKARGVKLGASRPESRNLTPDARQRGAASTSQAARLHHAGAMPIVAERHAAGATLREIAAELNGAGFLTPRGLPYSPTAVHRLLKRVA